MIYKGRKGRYKLKDKSLAQGGEGAVYEIENCPSSVAKIYHADKIQACGATLERKLKAMKSVPINPIVDGKLKVAWPQDMLYDGDRFVGFVMPKLATTHKIYHIQQDEEHRYKMFPDYTWKYAVQYAYNLSWVVYYLHLNNIIIGDMNMNNIAIDKLGNITLIDCDSFDITDPVTREHFKCEVGMPELLAPEIQGCNRIVDATFTKEADDFSLGIHIFRLLMMNADPFCAKLVGYNVDSVTCFNSNLNILNGESPYFRKLSNKVVPEWAPPIDILPPDIIDAFRNTFYYTQTTSIAAKKRRTTAEQWNSLLLKYAQAEPNPNLKSCSNHHVYYAQRPTCPFCEMNDRKKSSVKKSRLFGLL